MFIKFNLPEYNMNEWETLFTCQGSLAKGKKTLHQ